jgi:hypothetical protein
MIHRRLPNRRAVSLTELLLILSICTMILSTSGVLLHRVMRIESESRAFADAERACTRLNHQFRSDVHQASAAKLNQATLKEGVFLKLELPDRQIIEYARERDRLHRTARSGDKVTVRDEFIIPATANLTINQLQSPNRIVLSIAPPSVDATTDADRKLQSYRAVPVGVQIEATLNRLTSIAAQSPQEQAR